MTHAAPRMTRVNYILPTGDGRVLELRVAAAPDQFDRLVPIMKKAVETFRLIPNQPVATPWPPPRPARRRFRCAERSPSSR
jgi:hypothetical protein